MAGLFALLEPLEDEAAQNNGAVSCFVTRREDEGQGRSPAQLDQVLELFGPDDETRNSAVVLRSFILKRFQSG